VDSAGQPPFDRGDLVVERLLGAIAALQFQRRVDTRQLELDGTACSSPTMARIFGVGPLDLP
jgi:hypothetical protein